MNIMFL